MTIADAEMIREANAWRAGNFAGPADWIREFMPAMIDEIDAAVTAAAVRDLSPTELKAEDFPLPETAPMLAEAGRELDEGRGFASLRGWPAADYDYRRNLLAFCGVAAHLGEVVVQNYEGDRLVDVHDLNRPYSHESRGYMSNKMLPFHTDGADLVGLLCLGIAAEGGLNILVSATEVHNTIQAERPDAMAILKRGFYHHRRGQHDPGENPLSPERIPVFEFQNGLLHCCYNRNPVDWAEKEGVVLTPEEVEVLDYFDSVVARPEMQLTMDFHPGDMQFVNNFVILHSRTEYQDDATHRRHLVRLWMETPTSKRNGRGLLDLYIPGSSRFEAASN